MGQIQVLSEVLANQIAAGEVVERPASCVKELVENSLDAGAKSIRVAITDGGIANITVQDDGCGMDEADAKLAFARHATSKIQHTRDLLRIATMGFRGEALASIGAVARVSLQTRPAEQPHGIQVVVNGGEAVDPPQVVGIPPGTKIEVSDLFYNTPARLKYLRTVATEQARCIDVVHKAALSRPDVAFRCEVDGHTVFQTNGRGDVREVLAALYGVGEARQFLPIAAETADYRVSGWIGRPNQSKASRSHGHLFVNHRSIRNIAVQQAVVEGYGHRLMVNRHPLFALYIDMDPSLVDVNIHPHKAEVRFSEERDIVLLVQQAVRKALDDAFLVPDASLRSRQPSSRDDALQASLGLNAQEVKAPYRVAPEPASRDPETPAAGNRSAYGYPGQAPVRSPLQRPTPRAAVPSDAWKPVLGAPEVAVSATDVADEPRAGTETVQPSVSDVAVPRPEVWRLRPIGQALGMYIVADDGENLYVIDQHAAHERVLYERFTARMKAAQVHSIALLTPLSLTLTGDQYTAVQERQEVLAEMGLAFEPFGGRDMLLRQIPCVWEGLDYQKLVDDFLQELTELAAGGDVRDVIRNVIVTKACKAAIKANKFMSEMEMDALCEALSNLEDPFHCPHGRPIFVRLSAHELEKEFRRIV